MNSRQFDQLMVKWFGGGSRRQLLGGLAFGGVSALAASVGLVEPVTAGKRAKCKRNGPATVIDVPDTVGPVSCSESDSIRRAKLVAAEQHCVGVADPLCATRPRCGGSCLPFLKRTRNPDAIVFVFQEGGGCPGGRPAFTTTVGGFFQCVCSCAT